MNCRTPDFPVLHYLLEFAQTHLLWITDAIQPSHPLLSPSPPALNLSSTRVFCNESALHIRWPKYWSFSFDISPSNDYLGLISFRMDWFDLLVVQGTLKSFLQIFHCKLLQNIGCNSPCAVLCLVVQSCPTLATLWTITQQAPLSMGILQARILE